MNCAGFIGASDMPRRGSTLIPAGQDLNGVSAPFKHEVNRRRVQT